MIRLRYVNRAKREEEGVGLYRPAAVDGVHVREDVFGGKTKNQMKP